jgi:hypothetical protein
MAAWSLSAYSKHCATQRVRCQVAAARAVIAQAREFAMSKPKLRAATIRVEPELWERIERLAEKDRRPVPPATPHVA